MPTVLIMLTMPDNAPRLSLAAFGCLAAGSAQASLVAFQQYTGHVGYSADGFGSTGQSGTISASVPLGSTVLAAYLYTSTYYNTDLSGVGGTLNGVALSSLASLGTNLVANLTAGRYDVTSIVKPVIDSGAGGVYDFRVTETSSSQDGEALVVVYSNPLLSFSTVGVLDGFASSTGDTTSINFASGLNPAAPGFFAELALGIGFSCCSSQRSTVAVNGTIMTTNAGNNDDGVGSVANGQLITVGGFNDPYSPANPSYTNDHERYNLVPYIQNGDTSIVIDTVNPSKDDNIFLALVHVSGAAGVNSAPVGSVPEPGSLALIGLSLAGLAGVRRWSQAAK